MSISILLSNLLQLPIPHHEQLHLVSCRFVNPYYHVSHITGTGMGNPAPLRAFSFLSQVFLCILYISNEASDAFRPCSFRRIPCRKRARTAILQRQLFFDDVVESSFAGAGELRPELAPQDIPPLLMEALEFNDFPNVDSGLRSVWEFAGPTTRHIFKHNRTEFIESAHETANTMVTSFYGAAMKGTSWEMETDINLVGGKDGWIATQVMKTICSDGRLRRWQWELRKTKRPPNMNCWYVESIGSSDRKGNFEPE